MRLWACGVVVLALACVCSASAATSSGWIQLKTPSAAASWRLRDVATLSARKALLVGIDATTGGALVARYDGQRFRAVYRAATPSVLQGVAKTRTGQAWAVGYTNPDSSDGQDPLIAHFAGSWHASTSPHLDVQGNLYDVAAVNDHNVWAVGSTSHDGWYNTRSLVEHYNGRRWRVVPSPNPSRCPPRRAAWGSRMTWSRSLQRTTVPCSWSGYEIRTQRSSCDVVAIAGTAWRCHDCPGSTTSSTESSRARRTTSGSSGSTRVRVMERRGHSFCTGTARW